jgi:hypothetical protein
MHGWTYFSFGLHCKNEDMGRRALCGKTNMVVQWLALFCTVKIRLSRPRMFKEYPKKSLALVWFLASKALEYPP